MNSSRDFHSTLHSAAEISMLAVYRKMNQSWALTQKKIFRMVSTGGKQPDV
jgi:hypothetical protein